MSRFVLKNNPRKVVKIGDSQELIKHGIVVKVDGDQKGVPLDLDIMDLIEHLAKRINWKTENLKKYMENLFTINPVAVYQTLLKEGAIILDNKYDGHISEVKNVYAVSILDGEIFELEQVGCGNYTNVALFRTPSDAAIVKKALALIEAEIFDE